jgi:hypothetical protein
MATGRQTKVRSKKLNRFSTAAACLLFAALSVALCAPVPAEATLAPTDVMFVFDTSGSMEPVLQEAKAEMQEVMTRLRGSIPSVEFGVAEVKDTGEEESGIYAWKLDQPVTANTTAISEAIEPLQAIGGGDPPEAYGRALYETDTNPQVSWRPGARHLIVLIADQVPHMPNVNEGINEAFWVSNPFETGEELEAAAGIADTQWSPGVNIQFTEDLKRLVTDEKPLEMVDYHDTEGDYIHYWEYWAKLGGGSALPANEAGKELATRLIGLVESGAVQCASTATPGEPSPGSNGLPTALTPRFGQAGSRVTVTAPTDTQFCPEDGVRLGGATVPSYEEASPSKRAFRVPTESSSGLGIAGPSGLLAPAASFEVDNFREPWGFSIINERGLGDQTYDSQIGITRQDLESVFADLGGPGTAAYTEAKEDAESLLGPKGGLCYGFSLLSWELYLDAHGNTLPLGWSNWSGSTLTRGQQPIKLPEGASGSHALTHDLLRAAVSQYSPEAEEQFVKIHSAAELAAQLNSGFSRGQPVPLNIHWSEGGFLGFGAKHEGHTMLAFNYMPAGGGGITVNVVDPNVPALISPQTEAYPRLQIHVNADGSWNYLGSFLSGTYKNPVSEGSGTIEAIPNIRVPGGLNIPANVHHWWDLFAPAGGATINAISYGAAPGHGFPSDVQSQPVATDTFTQRLLVPTGHHVVTATITGPAGASTRLTAPGFIDSAGLGAGAHVVTLDSTSGALSVPVATSKTALSVTRVSDGVQYTVEAHFTGKVKHPTIAVSSSGAVTITTAGGNGSVTLSTGTYLPNGERAVNSRSRTRLHGRTHIHRHTPKIKRRKHKRSKRRPQRKK